MGEFKLINADFFTELCSEANDYNCCYKRKEPVSMERWEDEPPGHKIMHCTQHTLNDAKSIFQRCIISCSMDNENEKYRILLNYDDAPNHLKFNPYIRSGYRTFLSTKLCIESIFWWTNETVNIWSHILGWLLFVCLTFSDIQFLSTHTEMPDKIIVGVILACFQLCMIFSSIYHTFSCRSEEAYDCFLTYDLFGIALSLLAIYISGIYYAFWCHENLRNFYAITVGVIFIAAMVIQIPRLNVSSNIKLFVFVAWAAYGVVPTAHWTIEMGGFQNAVVKLLVPRVIGMYFLCAIAFFFYITRIPERWLVGKVDFFGHSHNWWHMFILVALYYWHNTGIMYLDFRTNNGCGLNLVNA